MTITAGTRLGPYEILAPIGAGGMGEVYRARDTRLGRDVALKVLPAGLSDDADRLRRFELEARAASALNHPNIIAVHDIGLQDGSPYVVSELLEGESLRDRMRGGPLPVRKAVDYALQVAHGLAAAHEKGIVHRDLKPDNVFITSDGRAKILDFGLARQLGPEDAGKDTRSPTPSLHTDPGTVLGTVGYMSPEQVRGQPADARSDIFSFGAVLYEMLSGARAFVRETAAETMTAILKEDPPELSQPGRPLPPALQRIVEHCLEKNPQERFQSARDLAFDLAQTSGSGPALAAARVPRARWWPWAASIGLALAAGYAAGHLTRPVALESAPPTFRRLTFGRGSVTGGRFAPDGHTVVYSAAWEGRPSELFSTRPERPESLPIGVSPARLLAVSRGGELAVAMRVHGGRIRNWVGYGTLARTALLGGAPREVMEEVQEADWAPDGSQLAIVRDAGGANQLEFPPGRVLYKTNGYVSDVRVSPRGDRIAFMDHPTAGNDRGRVAVVDLAGHKTDVSKIWETEHGLAWAPSGEELWFSAIDRGPGLEVHASTLAGQSRRVYASAHSVVVRDIAADGRVLLEQLTSRPIVRGRAPGAAEDRSLTWFDWPLPHALSRDGRSFLFSEQGQAGGPGYGLYLGKTDGSPAVLLGEGYGLALSPDGKWALSMPITTDRLVLLPTRAGEARTMKYPSIETYSRGGWFIDERRFLFIANEKGHRPRSWVGDIDGREPRPITPEGVIAFLPSPDGNTVLARRLPDPEILISSINGGEPRALKVFRPAEAPIQWTPDGRSVYVRTLDVVPEKVFRVELATGRRELVKEFAPVEPSGVARIGTAFITPDGKGYVYSYTPVLSELYLVEGLR